MSGREIFSISLATLAVFFLSTAACALSLDGIPDSGAPNFEHTVSVKMDDQIGRLTVKQAADSFTFFDATTLFNGTAAFLRLDVRYTNSGDFIRGTLKIKGQIDDLGTRKSTTLVTANISNWNVTDDANLWGFATSDIVCSPLLLVQCTLNESVYITLVDGFDGKFNNGKFESLGTAITTVPIPAAAWLFGSGLALLAWIRRPGKNTRAA
jgi:hypothetical protein